MPNMSGLRPGEVMCFLSFNHATNDFETVATGKVSDDGSSLVTDPGAGISTSGWGGFCPPYPSSTTARGNDDSFGCQETDSFIKSLFQAGRRDSCFSLESAPGEGIDFYYERVRSCQQANVQCVQQVTNNACSVPGAICADPSGASSRPTPDAVIGFTYREAKAVVEELFGGGGSESRGRNVSGASSGESVTLMSEAVTQVFNEVPAIIIEATAELHFVSPPPRQMSAGDSFQFRDIAEFGFGEAAFGFLKIIAIGTESVTLEASIVDPEFLPAGIATLGGQSAEVRPGGGFNIQNIAATPGTLIRPRVTYFGSDVHEVID